MTTGTARAARWLEDGQLKLRDTPMIFMYHGVADVDEDPNQLCVSPARFAEQMAWLARRGLRGVGIAELVDAMRAGRQRGLVGLTFDDGYSDHFLNVFPLLEKRGIKGCFFPPAQAVLEHRVLDVNKIQFVLASAPSAWPFSAPYWDDACLASRDLRTESGRERTVREPARR